MLQEFFADPARRICDTERAIRGDRSGATSDQSVHTIVESQWNAVAGTDLDPGEIPVAQVLAYSIRSNPVPS